MKHTSSQFPVLSSQKNQCRGERPRPSVTNPRHSTGEGARLSNGLLRWLKFNLVGGIGIGVQLAALAIFRSLLHMDYPVATALAVETTVLHNFLWHERFTWIDRPAVRPLQSLLRLVKFNVSNGAVSIAGNVLVMRLLVGPLRFHYIVANLIAIVVCSLANFLLGERLVFATDPNSTT